MVVVQLLSHAQLFATPWTAALQASLSFTISQNLFKLMSMGSMMPSNHLVLCHPLLLLPSIFPSIRIFSMSWLFASGGQSIGTSASVFPMNIRSWFPLGWTGLISLQSKGLSRVFSSTPVWKHQWLLWGEVILGQDQNAAISGGAQVDGVAQSSVWKHDVWVCWSCSHIISCMVWLNQQIFISSQSGDWEVQDQFGLANLVSGETSLPALQTATFSPHPQMTALGSLLLEGH